MLLIPARRGLFLVHLAPKIARPDHVTPTHKVLTMIQGHATRDALQ